MSNLLKTELYKLFHSWYFWGIGIFNILLSSILLLDSKERSSNLIMASLYNIPLLYFLIIVFIYFSGGDQEKLCGVLSGGERNRLHLAMALKEEGNVLLLDEPTNDIDVNTLRALEEGLEDFAGCAVVISHDRWFLDRICTHILAFEGDSNVFYFEGSYSEYEENKMKRLGNEEPKRVRYRKLMTD